MTDTANAKDKDAGFPPSSGNAPQATPEAVVPPPMTAAGRAAEGGSSGAVPPSSAPEPAPRRGRGWLGGLLVLVLALCVGMSAVIWQRQEALRLAGEEWRVQAQRSADLAREAQSEAARANAAAAELSRHVESLRSETSAGQQRLDTLDQSFQLLVDRGADLVLLNDIEHLTVIAQQQLRLSGNVANAIISLETAQAQLARINRPQFASLLQAVNGDLERLRLTRTVDINQVSSRLDELAALLAKAPLLVPERAGRGDPALVATAPATAAPEAAAPPADSPALQEGPWWQEAWRKTGAWSRSAWDAVREDAGRFIAVRRVDDEAALLLSPEQADRLRDQLRLRLMTARLALLMRQPAVWETEMSAVVRAIGQRYDMQSPDARRAEQLAVALSQQSVAEALPTVDNTLRALHAAREQEGQSVQPPAVPEPLPSEPPAEAPAELPVGAMPEAASGLTS